MKKHLRSQRGRLVALGTLAITAISTGNAATAQSTGPTNAPAQPDSQPVSRFDIPAGGLDQALALFRQQSGQEVSLRLGNPDVSGIHTNGVHGLLSPQVALKHLMEGTGLISGTDKSGAFEISIRNEESVDVTTAANSVALSQFLEPLVDTGQTVNVVPQFIMQEQHANTLKETLRNVPGISLAAGEGGSQGDGLVIRGFNARNDMFLDGIRDFGNYYRDSFNYESISVLQGPASIEFGRGSTGGVINQESKLPNANPSIRGGVQFGTNLNRRINLDFNQPLDDVFLPSSALRVNLVGQQSHVAGRDIAETNRYGVAPSLVVGLNKPTRYTLSYLHESEDSTPDYGLPYFGSQLAPVDRHTFYGFATDNFLRTSPDVVTGRVDHDFNDHMSLRSTLRWANYPRDIRATEALIPSAGTVNAAATLVTCAPPACFPMNTPIASLTATRNQLQVKSVEDMLWEQTGFIARVKIAGIENDISLLVEGGRERSNPQRPRYNLPPVSILNPNPFDPFVATLASFSVTHVASQSFGFNALDTLKLTRWLQLSGGIRFDYFNTHSEASPTAPSTTPVILDTLDKKPTYRAGIVVKPRPNGSIYFNYGTSFNPSAESLSLSANNVGFLPEENTTYESGTKWDLMNGALNLSGAWFRTEKLNAKETDPNDSANTLTSGTQLVRGFQVGAIGHLRHHMDIIAGYAYIDGRLTFSNLNASPFAATNAAFFTAWQNALKTNPAATVDPRYNTYPFYINPVGNPLANVPKNTGNLWVTHDLFFRFVGGFGGNYVGPRRASSAAEVALYPSAAPISPSSVPLDFRAIKGYWNFDAMLRRPINDHLNLQVNVFNLTNGYYIQAPWQGHLIPGEALNAQFSLNARF